jgi:Transposase and inactivated derivatives
MATGTLFHNKYRIPSARLQDWDYRTSAPYFITICTKNREHLFGFIKDGEMHLNDLGALAVKYLEDITTYNKCAAVINGIVMLNHVHAIIELENPTDEFSPNSFGPLLKNSISSIVNHFKGRVTRYANDHLLPFGWQERFHDHIIRDLGDYERIFNYITNNPRNWEKDKFY